nr:venom allergen (val) protein [Hymenolepis microstoma]
MQALNALVLVLLCIYQVRAAYYYRNQKCCKCPEEEEHTTVNNNTPSGSLSKEKQELLDLHNQYRREVAGGKVPNQPGSSKLKDLEWSTELEASAQKHADSCIFEHDGSDDRKTAQWWWVGQNIAYSSSVAQNVKMWFDEYKDYNYNSNYCSGVCGHYTQLVWADTTHVGCGVSRCTFSGFNAVYVVCNYGPGGNLNRQKPY